MRLLKLKENSGSLGLDCVVREKLDTVCTVMAMRDIQACSVDFDFNQASYVTATLNTSLAQ